MKLENRKWGSFICFVDSASDEALLRITVGDQGAIFVAFHLYDRFGNLVAECPGEQPAAQDIHVECGGGELLLDVPADRGSHIQYRLYNGSGDLITASDGARTQVFGLLRMEGVAR
jgi:hypothetical protein